MYRQQAVDIVRANEPQRTDFSWVLHVNITYLVITPQSWGRHFFSCGRFHLKSESVLHSLWRRRQKDFEAVTLNASWLSCIRCQLLQCNRGLILRVKMYHLSWKILENISILTGHFSSFQSVLGVILNTSLDMFAGAGQCLQYSGCNPQHWWHRVYCSCLRASNRQEQHHQRFCPGERWDERRRRTVSWSSARLYISSPIPPRFSFLCSAAAPQRAPFGAEIKTAHCCKIICASAETENHLQTYILRSLDSAPHGLHNPF